MTDAELNAELSARRAAVVHFSHHAKMREGGVFPDDLQAAILNKDDWPLSCSVLWPGHRMRPCGSVGVVFRPLVASVLSVSNSDSGSYAAKDGGDNSLGQPLSLDTLRESFNVVGAYNEWRLQGAEVVGIFVHNIYWLEAKKLQDVPGLPDGEVLRDIGPIRIELDEVFDAFPAWPVFTMSNTGLVLVSRP